MVITQNNFNSEVENSDKPVLIDFWGIMVRSMYDDVTCSGADRKRTS